MYLTVLYAEVSESLVSFSHTVSVFFLFESSTFTFAGGDDFVSQFFCHATTVSFTAVTDQPLHAERNFSVCTNFGRDLESSTTNSTAAYFYSRRNIAEGFFPYFIPIFTGCFRNTVQSSIEQGESCILFTFPHQVVDEPCHHQIVIPGIRC